MARPAAPGSVIVPDWHENAEGKEYLACILRKNRRRVFGIQTTVVFWPAKLQASDRVVMFRFEFWDCGESALKKFDHMLPACKDKTDAFLFLFSFTDRASFEDLPGQLARVAGEAPGVVRMVIGSNLPASLGAAPPAGEECARAAAGRWTHAGWTSWAGRHGPRAQQPGRAAVAPGPGGSWPAPHLPRRHPQLRGDGIVSGHSKPSGDLRLGQEC
ncbi:ciliogenesis and planar polarity effector 2 isoform X2 [Vicugna pacos]|uniref:Ciliogenesis and planar polarity effector 2 isoform X2 n=1 Tax=Vicugna pacos TaxID=30538 RepID=A0ABM5EE29_VICPA